MLDLPVKVSDSRGMTTLKSTERAVSDQWDFQRSDTPIPVSTEPSTRRYHWPFALQTIVACVALASVALGAFVAVGRLGADDDRRLLEKRSAEVVTLVTAGLGEVRSALTLLSSLTSPDNAAAFATAVLRTRFRFALGLAG